MRAGSVQDECWICGCDLLPDDNFCRKCGINLTRVGKATAAMGTIKGDHRVSIGIFLMTLGGLVGFVSYLMEIIPMLAFGLASLLIGIMILYLPESNRSITSKLATDSSLPSLLNTEKLLEDLDLDERGIYIPVSGMGVCPKVFVPLVQTRATERPPVGLSSSSRIFVTVGKNPEDRGILLDAPGSQILSSLERSLGRDLAEIPLEDLQTNLDSAFRTLDIAKATTLTYQESTVSIETELMALLDLEEKLRNTAPRLVAQIGTPVASALAAAVSKSTAKYVTFKRAVLQLPSRRLSISLRLSE